MSISVDSDGQSNKSWKIFSFSAREGGEETVISEEVGGRFEHGEVRNSVSDVTPDVAWTSELGDGTF